MSRHRHHDVRPRYGRMSALFSSVSITAIAVLGGVGMLPSSADEPTRGVVPAVAPVAADLSTEPGTGGPDSQAPTATAGIPGPEATHPRRETSRDNSLPQDSGSGRRVVFSQGRQRVWLVSGGHHVARTYLVSGSLTDNLDPGTYEVYSRSVKAWGIDDSGTMRYFVRFAHGKNAAIGFHDIPVDDGHLVQTRAQLGTPQSHGCIRQDRPDAIALWKFAPLGTTVVVTA
jgi:L,D-transpeptidase catalytic domain